MNTPLHKFENVMYVHAYSCYKATNTGSKYSHAHMYASTHTHRPEHAEIQNNRQTYRQVGRQAEEQTGRQAD